MKVKDKNILESNKIKLNEVSVPFRVKVISLKTTIICTPKTNKKRIYDKLYFRIADTTIPRAGSPEFELIQGMLGNWSPWD